ncbi:signal peptidase I [Bacillus mangrovi]|uniref:Signal peptidase I n=1 Tax=Metabacillus mangrovi TaxID=1491830 RepID=A0A7X2V470_9BACI|nr:signal peptidase I [Metabacillus mangrovi]MTH52723.1 signal peptidase I [Metabacillus mangrovi]
MAKNKNELFEWLKAIGLAVVIALVIRQFLFTTVVVDGESMLPALHPYDRMIVNKAGFAASGPDRFEIVVFHASEGEDYIKRIIGLPGDTVEYRRDQLYINGKAIDEPFLEDYKKQLIDPPLTENFTLSEAAGRKKVPEGHVFVMGDNRRISKDSRHIGTVPVSDIMGEANFVYWPLSDIRIVK